MPPEEAIAPRRRKQPVEKAPRVRISLRLEATVCKKLDQLAKLRGLDRNTAVGVAIVSDWLASIGTDRPELDQEPLRLEATVCKKLDQLAKLRGLDRNTAVGVAIVQDWLASIGTDRPELDQEPGSMKEGGENGAWKKIR